jgi:hypothetical protein
MLSNRNNASRQDFGAALLRALVRLLEFGGMILIVMAFLYSAWILFVGLTGQKSAVWTQTIGDTEVVYYPVPGKEYYFGGVKKSFTKMDLSHLNNMDRFQLEGMILQSTPKKLRKRLKKYISSILLAAEKYQVDPFWVIAVMWTESHFVPGAKSSAAALGLMQIKADTGVFLSGLMKRKHLAKQKAEHFLLRPKENIEIGTYYLKRLLKRFNGNYKLATVAYNMGPTRVRRRLRKKLSVGVNNHYLNKVQRAYGQLSKSYRRMQSSNAKNFVMGQGVKKPIFL